MFTKEQRQGREVWRHKSKPHWIVHYPSTKVRGAHYQAYRAVEKVPQGHGPWTVDNRRMGGDDGFESLESAMQAAA